MGFSTVRADAPTGFAAAGASSGFGITPGAAAAPLEPYVPPKSYSDEQMAIINDGSDVTVGVAFAGTGKSSTGIGYAVHHPEKWVQVICFNNANALELRHKFSFVSSRVKVDTAHSLARKTLTPGLNARVQERWNSVTLRSELPLLGARGDVRTAALVHAILSEFMTTTDEQVDPYKHGRVAREKLKATDATIQDCTIIAQRFWYAMNSETPIMGMHSQVNTIAIPHNAYLKMFVMRGERLPVDTVIFDEAQDANPIMLRLLHNQYSNGVKTILLGDVHQSIYEFNGAVNALSNENLPAGANVLPLTQSWRFGPKTAAIANFILSELKGETREIQGMGKDEPYKHGAPITYISRTNSDLLARAVSVMGEGCEWIGGIEGYRVAVLNDVWALKCGRLDDIRDFYIKKHYTCWSDFEKAAEYDQETKILCTLIDEYGAAIPEIVQKLLANAAKTLATGEIQMTLTTGHKSKGMERDYVHICNDFRNVFDGAESWLAGKSHSFPEQEINLMYVIATRAKKLLTPNREMDAWFDNIDRHRRKRVRVWGAEATNEPQQTEAQMSMSRAARAFAGVKRPGLFRP